jgi:hypothetical protein
VRAIDGELITIERLPDEDRDAEQSHEEKIAFRVPEVLHAGALAERLRRGKRATLVAALVKARADFLACVSRVPAA